jgi:hypothetical protein
MLMADNRNTSATSLKPYKVFPVTPRRSAKQWVRKHNGYSHYFGHLDDWESTLV